MICFIFDIRRGPVLCFQNKNAGLTGNNVIHLAGFDVFTGFVPKKSRMEPEIDIVQYKVFI